MQQKFMSGPQKEQKQNGMKMQPRKEKKHNRTPFLEDRLEEYCTTEELSPDPPSVSGLTSVMHTEGSCLHIQQC